MSRNDTDIERITVLMRNDRIYDQDSTRQPVAVKVDGQIVDWPAEGITEASGHLLVNGRRFLFERGTRARFMSDGLGDESVTIYRYPRGWRVLTEIDTETGSTMAPMGKWPVHDRSTAWELASRDITKALAMASEPRRAVLVWQDGDDFGEPIAELDGRNHTRAQAVQAMLSSEWLPWDWENANEAEEVAPSPASEEPSTEHSTTEELPCQANVNPTVAALIIRYKGMAPRPAQTFMSGRLVRFELDGVTVEPPANSVAETRLALKADGYEVDFTAWRVTDKANTVHGQERREVYRLTSKPALGPVDHGYLAIAPGVTRAPEITDEQRQRWLASAQEAKEQTPAESRLRPDKRLGASWNIGAPGMGNYG